MKHLKIIRIANELYMYNHATEEYYWVKHETNVETHYPVRRPKYNVISTHFWIIKDRKAIDVTNAIFGYLEKENNVLHGYYKDKYHDHKDKGLYERYKRQVITRND